jgi:hypothetical protein
MRKIVVVADGSPSSRLGLSLFSRHFTWNIKAVIAPYHHFAVSCL